LPNLAVEVENVGRPKASTVSALVHELNESVTAKFLEESPESVIESNAAFFAQFTIVIATQVIRPSLVAQSIRSWFSRDLIRYIPSSAQALDDSPTCSNSAGFFNRLWQLSIFALSLKFSANDTLLSL
jgi:hypothetical protein